MENIYEYVYDNRNQPVGVVAAVISPDDPTSVYIGWSRCNRSAGDRFDKSRGVQIALDRALTKGGNTPVPDSLTERVDHMKRRAQKYFRDRRVFSL